MKKKLLNYEWGTIAVQWNEQEAAANSEVMIYDTIGRDSWSSGGIKSSEFESALNELPAGRDCDILVNSKGGDVHEGMAMMNAILRWKNRTGRKVNTIYTGIAASTSSWAFACASDNVQAYRGSQVFVHDAIAFGYGNADDMREIAGTLDTTSDQIASFYAEMTGKSKKAMRDMMRDSRLMTAEEAEEEGFVDSIANSKATRNFTTREIVNMSNYLVGIQNSVAKRGGDINNNKGTMKKRIIAVLNSHGLTEWEGHPISEETTEAHLEAALTHVLNEQKAKAVAAPATPPADDSKIVDLQKQINRLETLANTANELRITNEIDTLIKEDKLTEKEKPKALARALKDPEYINEIKDRLVIQPGGSPVSASRVELVGNSFAEVQNFLLDRGPKFMRNFIGPRSGDHGDGPLGRKVCEDIRDNAIIVSNTIKKHKAMLVEMYNANTIDAGLQRQIILSEMLEEFAIVLLPFANFSTVFNSVPLEGTDEVDVPFYPLATDNGTSWDPTTGYATMGSTATNTRPVVVGGSGTTSGSSAPANTAKDRKWIGAQFSSYELARQPYLNVQKLMVQKANRLAVLIFQDVVSRVITAGNFGASVKAIAAPQFSADDIADLWENATGRNWPARGRSLTLTHQYKTPLLKDNTFKSYLAYGATDPLRKAMIQEAYGFEDIPIVPNLDTYSPSGEFLRGWIAWQYAVLMATSPIMPTAEVRALMTRYDVAVHPSVGIAFEYRRFGDTTLDVTKEVVECSYGAAKGVASALARITSQ